MSITVDLNRPHPDLVSVHIGDAPLDTMMVISLARHATDAPTPPVPRVLSRRIDPSLDHAERDATTWEDAEWR